MKKWMRWTVGAGWAVLLAAPAPGGAAWKAVATLPDLGALLKEVGGDRVSVGTVGRGDQDPHYVPAKPSLLRMFRGARFLAFNGMEMEIGWLPVLLEGARNPALRPGGPGVFSASSAIARALEVPTGQLSRREGDIHPEGNPHHLLDPRNGARVALVLAERLAEVDPPGASYYRSRASAYAGKLAEKIRAWEARLAPYRGREFVTYHRTWSYLFDWAGLRYGGVIEDKPGIPPSPVHVSRLMEAIRARKISAILVANYTQPKIARRLGERTGAKVVILPASVGAEPGIRTYEDRFEALIDRLAAALEG